MSVHKEKQSLKPTKILSDNNKTADTECEQDAQNNDDLQEQPTWTTLGLRPKRFPVHNKVCAQQRKRLCARTKEKENAKLSGKMKDWLRKNSKEKVSINKVCAQKENIEQQECLHLRKDQDRGCVSNQGAKAKNVAIKSASAQYGDTTSKSQETRI